MLSPVQAALSFYIPLPVIKGLLLFFSRRDANPTRKPRIVADSSRFLSYAKLQHHTTGVSREDSRQEELRVNLLEVRKSLLSTGSPACAQQKNKEKFDYLSKQTALCGV